MLYLCRETLFNNFEPETQVLVNGFSQVVAVAARKLEDAQDFAQKHNILRAYGSYEELARDPDIGEIT